MLAIDQGQVLFEEEEFSDHTLSSGVGWTINVRAVRRCPLRGGVVADAVGAGKTINAIALIASGAAAAREARAEALRHASDSASKGSKGSKAKSPKGGGPKEAAASEDGVAASKLSHSGATLVIAPIHAVKPVWRQLLNEFTSGLKCEIIESVSDLRVLSVDRLRDADVVVVACELLFNAFGEGKKSALAYQEHLTKVAKATHAFPSFLSERKQSRLIGNEPDILTGVWVPNSSQDPFGKSAARQEDRDVAALFTVRYSEALAKLRAMSFEGSDKGVPIEWFTWERLIIDECHESLVLGQEDAERQAANETEDVHESTKVAVPLP